MYRQRNLRTDAVPCDKGTVKLGELDTMMVEENGGWPWGRVVEVFSCRREKGKGTRN